MRVCSSLHLFTSGYFGVFDKYTPLHWNIASRRSCSRRLYQVNGKLFTCCAFVTCHAGQGSRSGFAPQSPEISMMSPAHPSPGSNANMDSPAPMDAADSSDDDNYDGHVSISMLTLVTSTAARTTFLPLRQGLLYPFVVVTHAFVFGLDGINFAWNM